MVLVGWLRHLFVSPGTSQKTGNLTAQPTVVANAGDGMIPIILEGTAEIVTDRAERERINSKYMEKYVDPHSGAKAGFLDSDDGTFHIQARRVMAWEYRIVATRTDWQFNS